MPTQLDKPILVVIDDIDRLEKEELFEVLRLIRNTGNFTNLIYSVSSSTFLKKQYQTPLLLFILCSEI